MLPMAIHANSSVKGDQFMPPSEVPNNPPAELPARMWFVSKGSCLMTFSLPPMFWGPSILQSPPMSLEKSAASMASK